MAGPALVLRIWMGVERKAERREANWSAVKRSSALGAAGEADGEVVEREGAVAVADLLWPRQQRVMGGGDGQGHHSREEEKGVFHKVEERRPHFDALCALEPGKDAFHRVPDFARNEWDAVERVLTIPEDGFMES